MGEPIPVVISERSSAWFTRVRINQPYVALARRLAAPPARERVADSSLTSLDHGSSRYEVDRKRIDKENETVLSLRLSTLFSLHLNLLKLADDYSQMCSCIRLYDVLDAAECFVEGFYELEKTFYLKCLFAVLITVEVIDLQCLDRPVMFILLKTVGIFSFRFSKMKKTRVDTTQHLNEDVIAVKFDVSYLTHRRPCFRSLNSVSFCSYCM